MANSHSTLTGLFHDIANAIRNRNGSANSITADAFPTAIRMIEVRTDNAEEILEVAIKRELISISHSTATKVGSYAFTECRDLVYVDIPECSIVCRSAFYNCRSLETVNLPKCTILESDAFHYCTNLVSVYFPECVETKSGAFYGCEKINHINSLSKCLSLGSWTFMNCSYLTTINLPMCTSFAASVFCNCVRLSSIYLGASVVCELNDSLDRIFRNTPYEGNSNYFSGTPYIYVPSSLVRSYQTSGEWSGYSSYFKAIN